MKRDFSLKKLSFRERAALVILSFFLGAISLYFLITQPFAAEKARLSLAISTAQSELYWFKMANTYLRKHGSDSSDPIHAMSQQPLGGLLEESIKEYHLDTFSPSIQPQKSDSRQITVTFAQVPFDEAIKWVTFLWQKEGVTTTHAVITRLPTPGLTSMTITFKPKSGSGT